MKFNIFELEVFSFNSWVYYLTHGFIASTCSFNLLTCAFNLATRGFNLATRAFSLLTRGFELVTRELEFVTRRFELVTRGFEVVAQGFELVTGNSCFTFPPNYTVAELNDVFRKKETPIFIYKAMTLTLKLLSRSSDSTKMSFLPAIWPPVIRVRIVTPHTRLHVEP